MSKSIAALMFGASLPCLATSAWAQEANPATTGLAETGQGSDADSGVFGGDIVVTAQKREQNLQKVGVSVAAVQGDDLAALGVDNTDKIAAVIPSLTIQSMGGNDQQLIVNMRGVSQNDFGDQNEGPVAVYVDDAYVSWLGAIGAQTYDMERVEALRGPQGTLFGRNATGGLINFLSKKPKQTFDANIGGELSSHGSYKIDGAIGGAIGQGVAVRLAGVYQRNGNYVDNLIGPDLGNSEQYSLRGQVLFDLGGRSDLLLKGEYSEQDATGSVWTHNSAIPDPSNAGLGRFVGGNELAYPVTLFGTPGCAGCDAVGFKDADGKIDTVSFDTPGSSHRQIYNLQAKLNLDLGGVRLTSISDYRHFERELEEDTDAGPFTIDNFLAGVKNGRQFSQELRLAGDVGSFNWVAGLYYLKIDGDYSTTLNFTFTGDPTLDFLQNDFSLSTETYAAFAQGEYKASDLVTLIAGARWSKDKKRFSYVNTDGFGGGVFGSGLVFNQQTVGDLSRLSKGSVDFKLGVNLTPSDDVLVYGNISRGTKAGGFVASLDGLVPPDQIPYKQETLASYELGFKSSILDRRLRLNGSIFYYDYNDYQAFLLAGLSQQIVNLDAEIYGAELELIGQPAAGLDIMIGASYLHTRVQDVPLPDGSFADRRMPTAPTFSLKGLIRQSFQVPGGDLAAQIDANYQTSVNFNIVNHPTMAVDSYAQANGRLTYTDDDKKYSVSFFVENMFNKRVPVNGYDLSNPLFGGLAVLNYNRPRWFGGEVRVNF